MKHDTSEARTPEPSSPPPPVPPSVARRTWREAVTSYTRPHILLIGLLGFASGLPRALTGATLSLWLSQEGIDNSTIGLFTWVTVPFMFKFLWAPLMDHVPLPGVVTRLGQRRGWLVVVQLALAASILALGAAEPAVSVSLVAGLALVVASLSATQDIIIDGYRVALLPVQEQGHGVAVSVLGYRLGMLASGGGALFIVAAGGWFVAYAAMAALLVVVGLVVLFFAREPAAAAKAPTDLRGWLREVVWMPLADFTTRRHWIVLLVFIGLYRISDILAGRMVMPFYNAQGYSVAEIASITKVVGVIVTIVGGLLGGALLARLGILKGLLVCGVLQMVSNFGFALLAQVGHRLDALAGAVVLENLAAGMGTTALVALLSVLCNARFAATQYALLTSVTELFGKSIESTSGFMAEAMGWSTFFVLTALTALPALALLGFIMKNPPDEVLRERGGPPGPPSAEGRDESKSAGGLEQPTTV